jgi:hypothetical protein
MVEPETAEGAVLMTEKLENHDDVIEVFTDYKTGMRTLATATAELKKLGFEPGVAQAMLKAMKRDNVIDIRGYSKEPSQLAEGRRRWKARGACGKAASGVETDNKS